MLFCHFMTALTSPVGALAGLVGIKSSEFRGGAYGDSGFTFSQLFIAR